MRSEAEMLELILRYAQENDDVRAVMMNGSRVNPNAPKDLFQDYDIVYFVRSVEPYRRNWDIVRYFGEILILQTPEDMGEPSPDKDNWYSYLMQFQDGNRIDLSFHPLEKIPELVKDTLSVVLLDKDGLLGELPPPSDRGYLPQPPTEKMFNDCCNEFWWLNAYVAKGLWREELTYAKHFLDVFLREELMDMLVWYHGVQTGFQKSLGKQGKYLKAVLDDDLWNMLEATYADADYENNWRALFAMGSLFRRVARVVADSFGFAYPEQDDHNVSSYIQRIQKLPRDTQTIEDGDTR